MLNEPDRQKAEQMLAQLAAVLAAEPDFRQTVLAMFKASGLFDSLEEQVADRTRELSMFFDMTLLANEAHDLEDILTTAVGHIAEASYSQAVCLYLFAEDDGLFHLMAHQGFTADELANLHTVSVQPDIEAIFSAFKQHPIVTAHAKTVAGYTIPFFQLARFNALVGIPFEDKNKTLGFLCCYRSEHVDFSLNEISLISALAEQLRLVIENYRLRQEAKRTAVLSERQRLARELHDSITQALYSQTLFARAGQYAIQDGKTDKVREALQQLETNASYALKEMRLLLFQLQPTTLTDYGLVSALNERLDMVERRLGIEATCDVVQPLMLAADKEEALYRIALEALNNSLKHAEADEVKICFSLVEAAIVLEIIDNGRGFDHTLIQGGMGIRIMQERAGQLGGSLEINSSPGQGTIIRVITIAS